MTSCDAQQLRDELRAAGMPNETPVRVKPDGTIELDWNDPAVERVIAAHVPDPRYRWPEWKVELDYLLDEAEKRTLTAAEQKKVDKHMRTLARHNLNREKR